MVFLQKGDYFWEYGELININFIKLNIKKMRNNSENENSLLSRLKNQDKLLLIICITIILIIILLFYLIEKIIFIILTKITFTSLISFPLQIFFHFIENIEIYID